MALLSLASIWSPTAPRVTRSLGAASLASTAVSRISRPSPPPRRTFTHAHWPRSDPSRPMSFSTENLTKSSPTCGRAGKTISSPTTSVGRAKRPTSRNSVGCSPCPTRSTISPGSARPCGPCIRTTTLAVPKAPPSPTRRTFTSSIGHAPMPSTSTPPSTTANGPLSQTPSAAGCVWSSLLGSGISAEEGSPTTALTP